MQLKTLLFNMQDFFLFLHRRENLDLENLTETKWQILGSSIYPNKSLEKTFSTAKLIHDRNPDILMLVEVGGYESLDNFNKLFLDDNYQIFHEPSNSDRGIDLGFLVKKTLFKDLDFKFKPHTKIKLGNNSLPSRGFFQLDIYQEKQLKLTLMLTHLKSKLNLKNTDFEGRTQRSQEVTYLVKFFNKNKKKGPIVIAGDMNGIIAGDETEPELLPLAKYCDLVDVLDWQNYPIQNRATYLYFMTHKKVPMQLDYILVPKKMADKLCVPESAKVIDTAYLSKGNSGKIENLDQRRDLISDHFPVEVVFKLKD